MVKNITLSADESVIRLAREKAARENRSLNSVFREWLRRYVSQAGAADDYLELMRRLGADRAGRKFAREEMNER